MCVQTTGRMPCVPLATKYGPSPSQTKFTPSIRHILPKESCFSRRLAHRVPHVWPNIQQACRLRVAVGWRRPWPSPLATTTPLVEKRVVLRHRHSICSMAIHRILLMTSRCTFCNLCMYSTTTCCHMLRLVRALCVAVVPLLQQEQRSGSLSSKCGNAGRPHNSISTAPYPSPRTSFFPWCRLCPSEWV